MILPSYKENKTNHNMSNSYWDIQYPTSFYTNSPFNTYPIYHNFMSYQDPTPEYQKTDPKLVTVTTTIPVFTTHYL